MKILFVKQPGGTLTPAGDMESEKMTRFRTGQMYEVEMKLTRNPKFHSKMFSFFQFCFAHWGGGREFVSESKQFDTFRKDLTILAGFFEESYNIHGDVRIEAKSLAYANMPPEEFAECYGALITAAIKHIFQEADDAIYDRLMGFF